MSAGPYPNAQGNPAAGIPVYIAPAPAGAGPLGKNITTNASTAVKTGAGTFYGIGVNTAGVTSKVIIYDGLNAGGTVLGTFDTTKLGPNNVPGGGIQFAVGLFAVSSGGTPADFTVVYA